MIHHFKSVQTKKVDGIKDNNLNLSNQYYSNSAPSPFILVDIDAALDYNEGIGIDDDSIEYFKQLKEEGYLYVSVDNNNRSIALRNFADNEIIVPSNDYETSKYCIS